MYVPVFFFLLVYKWSINIH